MKTVPCSSRTQRPRVKSPGTMRSLSKSISLVSVLVFFMLVASAMGGIPCTTDSQCRRDVCIFSSCSSKSKTGGACQLNTHCFKAATESCISNVCATRSPTGGDCEEAADCATAGDSCSSNKCTTPLNPSLMVWDGNKAPTNTGLTTPSVAVNGILFVFQGYSSTSIFMTVEAYDPENNSWSSKTGPGIACFAHSVVAVGSSVFLIGGARNSNPLTTFFEYKTGTDSWDTAWPQLPEGRRFIAATAVDSTVFIFGGVGASSIRLDSIRSLDVSNKANSWNLLSSATLPAATSEFSATTVGTDIFLTGGRIGAGSITTTVYKYDSLTPTVSPSSTNLSPLLEAQVAHMSFYEPKSKRLYVLGGTVGQNAVEYLDLSVSSSGSWVSANAPNYFLNNNVFSGGLIDSLFHYIYGRSLNVLDVSVPSSVKWTPFSNNPSSSATIFQMTSPTTITVADTISRPTSFYDTVSNTWTTGITSSNYPTNTFNPASSVVNGEVFVMGGDQGGASAFATVYSLNSAGESWTQKDNMLAARTAGCAAADGTDIYYYGGASSPSSAPLNTLYKMDTTKPALSQWSEVPLAGVTPTAVNSCAAVVVGRKLLIFGGGTAVSGASPTGLIQSFDIPSQTWDSSLTASITPRSRLSAVYLKGFVFVIGGSPDGGSSSLNKTEVFDVAAKTVKAIKDMPTPRYGLGSVTDGSSIFSVGGRTNSIYFPSLEKLHTP